MKNGSLLKILHLIKLYQIDRIPYCPDKAKIERMISGRRVLNFTMSFDYPHTQALISGSLEIT